MNWTRRQYDEAIRALMACGLTQWQAVRLFWSCYRTERDSDATQ